MITACVHSLRAPPSPPCVRRATANETLALALLPELCSLYVPLAVPWSSGRTLPHLHYRQEGGVNPSRGVWECYALFSYGPSTCEL